MTKNFGSFIFSDGNIEPISPFVAAYWRGQERREHRKIIDEAAISKAIEAIFKDTTATIEKAFERAGGTVSR